MTAHDDAVKACARVLFEELECCSSSVEESRVAEAVVAEAEPIIRADERGKADAECDHLLEAASLAAQVIRAETELGYARAQVDALLHIRGIMEAEVASLHEQVDGYERIAQGMVAQATRELLDSLRIEAKGLPVLGRRINHADDCPGRPGYRGFCTCDRQMDELVSLDAVLRMLEEADRG